jgi:hypothetical protein
MRPMHYIGAVMLRSFGSGLVVTSFKVRGLVPAVLVRSLSEVSDLSRLSVGYPRETTVEKCTINELSESDGLNAGETSLRSRSLSLRVKREAMWSII